MSKRQALKSYDLLFLISNDNAEGPETKSSLVFREKWLNKLRVKRFLFRVGGKKKFRRKNSNLDG